MTCQTKYDNSFHANLFLNYLKYDFAASIYFGGVFKILVELRLCPGSLSNIVVRWLASRT